jgi:hypothetical protein
MDGLIEQAKSQLWKIVNEVGSATRDGVRPRVEVALYEYGKASLPITSGFIRQILPLTTDLDRVSEELFALKTNGGEEYCGMVIGVATRDLEWSADDKDLKLIFIAGNEPFTQGSVDFHQTVAAAKRRGITVNTIYCGPQSEGAATGWKDGAVLAQGEYMSIDQDRAIAHIDAPQDVEIAALGAKINETYIPYGANGQLGYARQSAQDANAQSVHQGAMISRSVSKASAAYDNTGWDLVDLFKRKKADLKNMAPADLPPAMKGMNAEEREHFVEGKEKERSDIQARIQSLNEERTKFVAAEMKKRAETGAQETLDGAMIRAIHDAGAHRGFRFGST